jgi:hypothetical protein
MNPININRFGGKNSNYELRRQPMKLFARTYLGAVPDGDGWAPQYDEAFGTEYNKTRVKPGLPRKQGAARQVIPLATIKLVTFTPQSVKATQVPAPVPFPVAKAIYEGKSPAEIKIAELEAKIAQLMGIQKGAR